MALESKRHFMEISIDFDWELGLEIVIGNCDWALRLQLGFVDLGLIITEGLVSTKIENLYLT